MKDKALFFITSEFPFGKGETFIENEIFYLADAFEKVFIFPHIKNSTERRSLPPNVSVIEPTTEFVSWTEVFGLVKDKPEIANEILSNLISNPLKNKILLKSLKNALTISKNLKKFQSESGQHASAYYSYWLDDGAIALALLDDSAIKVSRAHGWDVYFKLHKHKYLPLRKFLAGRLDMILTISKNGKKYLDVKTQRPEKIYVSNLGTNNENILSAAAAATENSGLNIISISSTIPLKRIDLIGNAVRLFDAGKVNWNHFGNGVLFEEVKNNFSFGDFHGYVENEKIKEYLKANSQNSILLNTSLSEGIPVSMMEAMSFGIPCIGTNVGGVSEIIEDGVNGFLIPANASAETIAEYIKKFSNLSVEEKNRLRQNSFRTWNENYNAAKNYPNFIDRLKSLISR